MADKLLGTRVRVFLNESDQWRGHNLADAIVGLCHRQGVTRVAALRGLGGFGTRDEIHTESVFGLRSDAPVIIEILDLSTKIEDLLPRLDDMIREGVLLVDEVELFKWGRG